MKEIIAAPANTMLYGGARPEFLRNETLADIFRDTAIALPEKTALVLIGTGESLTYAELDRRSSRLAAALSARGVKRGDFVGLWFKRSLDLHVAMIGIVKAGAAFIPFDAEAPADRVSASLADCGASLLLTHEALPRPDVELGVETLELETLLAMPANGVIPDAPRPDDIAYAIYTSGSTGKPKGIMITHRNICHYLRAGNDVLGIMESDVVLQQASVAFDLSMEEIWVPYLVGATLKVASAETVKLSDALPAVLEAEGITVIDTVPTLLSMFDRDVDCLRIIIVGGEACPASIVQRFARPGRRLFNTYGPTETTVVATIAELRPGDPVTIGAPIPNYTCYVVDEALNPVGPDIVGELLIGGPGVAKGYINLPDLTAKKFIANPFGASDDRDPLLYRSGDAVSVDAYGRIHFHGRIDDQVKIRGYRIELGEIESLIVDDPSVRTAAVAVHQDATGGDVLVAHVVAAKSDAFDPQSAKKALAGKVPPYMVPPLWRLHEELPRLASGKVDRKALARIPITVDEPAGRQEEPRSETEAKLLAAAQAVLGLKVIDFNADFFTDLGGHSMLAARFVSTLRKDAALATVTLQDIYSGRSLRKIGAAIDARAPQEPIDKPDLSFTPVPLLRRFLCGCAQAVALIFIIAIVTLKWIGLLLASIYLVRDGTPLWKEILILCSVFVSINLGAKIVVVALKWLIVGRTKPGIYPLWGAYYFRIWLMQRIVQITAPKFLQGSPLMRIYLRALGAKVGRDAIIQEFEEGAIDLISIGPRASLGTKVKLANVEVIGDKIYVGRIEIGADAHIGNACVIGYDSRIGEGAALSDLCAIPANFEVKPYEKWDGSPARKIGMVDKASLPEHPELSEPKRYLQGLGYFVTYNIVMMIGLLPIFPAFYVLYNLDNWIYGDVDYVIPWSIVPLLAWPSALVLVFVSMAIAVILRWTLLPRVEVGRYSIFSGLYFRKWTANLCVEAMLETLNSLYATVFMRNWYRLMGAKIGRGTEISANFGGRYDLIEMGENNFIGDETIFGDEDVHRGWMVLDRVKTADRVFFGNASIVPQGAVLESDSLIGVKSRLPESLHVKSGETWFGSPAIKLPTREKVTLAANWTYQPPIRMRIWRAIFEALHTSLPTAVMITSAYILADVIAAPIDAERWWKALGIFLVAGVIVAFIMYLISVVGKWVMMGIYRPIMKPMWSWWAMRTEAVSVFYGGLAGKAFLEFLRGTPFLPWALRAYGTKLGKGIWLNWTDITEFDCIKIGDHAVLNMHVCPQTHLYEDRVMKVGRIEIGRGVSIGTGSTILYDTKVEDFAQIAPLTLIMKGETIPAHTRWAGAPAQPVAAASVGAVARAA